MTPVMKICTTAEGHARVTLTVGEGLEDVAEALTDKESVEISVLLRGAAGRRLTEIRYHALE